MEDQKKGRDSQSVSRSQSHEVLDSSSASSLSVFADHCDGPTSRSRAHEILISESQKSGECSPSRASMDDALKSEAAFIQFLTSIPAKDSSDHHRSSDSMPIRNRSPAAGSTVSKVGLDHLDNLCKLMEQLGELRDNNNKLQKRVQYLEDLKTLHDMHKEICEGVEYSSEDALTPKPYPLQKSATESHCPKAEESTEILGYSRSPSKYLSRRSRHQQQQGQRRCRSKSVGHEDLSEDTKSKRIFPKWSRVKEAFGWESERKGSIKIKDESVLGSRRRSDESRQVYRHLGSPTWYQDFPSVQSSVEDIDEFNEGDLEKTSVTHDKYSEQLDVPHNGLRRQKSTPSSGSDKASSCREPTDLKPKSFTLERDIYCNQDFSKFDKDDVKRGKSPWGRVKTIIERHRDSLKRRSLRRDQSATDLDSAIGKTTVDSLDFKDYHDYLECQAKIHTASPVKQKGKKPHPIAIEQDDCVCPRTPSSSPTMQRKSRWNRVTKVLKGKKEGEKDSLSLSTPNTPNNQHDGNFTFDVIEEMSQSSHSNMREISRVGSDSHVHQLALAMPSSDIMLQLQRNLSEDFHRKIQEWDRMRASSGIAPSPSHWDHNKHSRKKSERDDKNIKPKIKDLTWLEKELQKIEKEKLRLAKERQKYEERAHRLEKLKETVLNANSSNKREVLVRTSAGEFRFEGISDAFTKKLYEWETKRGVGPELSTIALLDSSRLTAQTTLGVKPGPLQRVLSRSESSIAEIGQPSHNSSNSLPSVKLPDSSDADRINQPSWANSEPDLTILAALSNGTSISMVHHSAEASDADVAHPEASKESEEDDYDKPRKGSETYYGLLEENVILLEQLKEKEEICRRLEKDLGLLDEKMDEMNNRHVQETQRYREKLWEMHQQGATPRDVMCCRRTMEQLRKRIETLEMWTKKLRSDRDTVEINFRHHSKEQECMTLDLLEKMRELRDVGSSTADSEIRESSRMDANTIERLQELSALLTKQTIELEETLSEKTRQICHLKWELLHRDLSTVKQETEQHTHSPAHKKRSKYAHWRSRSSEEAPVSTTLGGTQKIDPANYEIVATEVYGGQSAIDELKATYLANTVQQLNKELMKLTSATSISSLSNYLQEDPLYTNAVTTSKNADVPRLSKKVQVPAKVNPRKITVRRSSADNLSLVSTDDNRLKGETSSTQSDDSSDEYYARVCYNSAPKSQFSHNHNNNDTERLLMSYGEHPPRTCNQRKKKFQKASKLNSALGRKRSNTFHTNRDLQKPSISENIPQKCQSFRVARENYLEDSAVDKISHSRRKVQNSHFNIRSQDIVNYKTKMDHKYQEAVSLRKSMGKVGVLENYNINWLREVASDSKLPILLQAQTSASMESSAERQGAKCPSRSMSDKTKNETAAEKREHIQKKRTKKRLKSPDPSFTVQSFNGNTLNSMVKNIRPPGIPQPDPQQTSPTTQRHTREIDNCKDSAENKLFKDSQTKLFQNKAEIPTITIQLPKRKQRKSSCVVPEASSVEEQTFTIVMPKKRSLSSECESSISESSPREASMSLHSDQKSDSPDSPFCKNPTIRSSTAPLLNPPNNYETNENGSIRLMRLVSLNNFETPFDKNGTSLVKKNGQRNNEQCPRKRKARQKFDDGSNSPTEEMVDMISKREKQSSIANPRNSNESIIKEEQSNSKTSPVSHYVKSPSAPQLDWRKVCAKKVSKSGAPNVRTLIERYNQKLIESQVPKSPGSSNLSSPATERKISTPVGSCCTVDFVPRYSSTPNTPTSSPSFNLMFSSSGTNVPQSPLSRVNVLQNLPSTTNLPQSSSSSTNFFQSAPSSPSSVARAVALRRAKEHFIASQSSTPTSPVMTRVAITHSHSSENRRFLNREEQNKQSLKKQSEQRRPEEDQMSCSSMDSMNVVMLRAGENCRESRMPKRTMETQRTEAPSAEKNNLKTSKSLSSSSLFKSVLSSDFKMPASLLRLKRSKRKKDMSAVTELCRQSLLLTTEDTHNILPAVSHKSCPNSPELKQKDISKSSWIQRNIFRHK